MFKCSPFVQKYALMGAALGSGFLLGGIAADQLLFRPSPVPIGELFDTNRLHFLVLFSPLVLGILFFALGKAHEQGAALAKGKRESDDSFKLLINNITDYAIYMLDTTGHIASWNPGAERVKGYAADEIVGKDFSIFYSEEERAAGKPAKGLATSLREGKFESEGWRYRKDGTKFWAQVVIDPVFDDDHTHVGFAKITRDRTEQKESSERIAYLAWHDALTGLPNRSKFLEQLDAALERADAARSRVAVVNVDLDRFGDINDKRGHGFGDRLLQILADRMKECSKDRECIARFGGDEFVALKAFADREELAHFVGRLHHCLTTRVTIDEFALTPKASFGIAIYPQDGTSTDDLVNNADLAMYRAKGSIDQSICYYEPPMDEAVRDRRAMAIDLRTAAEDGQFSLVYQEQRCAKTGKVVGYEALLRWNHPERGLVSPVDFLPVAEETGAILPIGVWVLRTACQEAVRLNLKEPIAVNLSPIQLSDPDLPALVSQVLVETGLPPSRLELEVTESAIIKDKRRALHSLRQLKAIGVSIAIDDFGTGYSSLDTLRSFPFNRLKMDRSFIDGLEKYAQSRAIVRTVLELGKCLNMTVLAEGVETREQASILTEFGCDEFQGFLFGRPAPMAMLRRRRPPTGRTPSRTETCTNAAD